MLARTAATLLRHNARSSYAIEWERPPHSRIERWGRAIGEAGHHDLDVEELLRLQALVICDARFLTLGLRREGGFVGEHDRTTRMPLPDHISARTDDLPSLMQGLIECEGGPSRTLDPVIAAAIIAFGFVYNHPFEDGNGRIHRYLIHHVLARHGFTRGASCSPYRPPSWSGSMRTEPSSRATRSASYPSSDGALRRRSTSKS